MDPRQTAETFNTVQPILFWLVAGLTALCAIATVVTQNIVRAATWLLFTLAGTSAIFFLLGADLVGATQLLVYVGGTLVLVVFGVMLTAQGPFISMKTSGAEWAISLAAAMLLLTVLMTGIITDRELGPDIPTKAPNEAVIKFSPAHSRAKTQALAGRPLPSKAAIEQAGPGGGPIGGPPGGPPQGKGNKGGKAGPGGAGKKGGGPPEKGPPGEGPGIDDKGAPGGVQTPPIGVPEKGLAPPEPEPVTPLDPATSAQSVTLGEGFLGVGVGPAHGNDKKGYVRTSYLLPFEIVSVHLLVVLIGAAYLARAKRRVGGPS
jgi:NADH:ubiquinone oxidoreductase subunit 6 (subunit J)